MGITRARQRAIISFTANRMIFGRWQSVLPSRFIDEMPPDHCEAQSETGYYDAGPGFEGVAEAADPFKSSYESPGWKRFQASKAAGRRPDPGVIEGQATLIDSSSVGGTSKSEARRPRLPPEIRLWHGENRRRRQAQRRPSDKAGLKRCRELC